MKKNIETNRRRKQKVTQRREGRNTEKSHGVDERTTDGGETGTWIAEGSRTKQSECQGNTTTTPQPPPPPPPRPSPFNGSSAICALVPPPSPLPGYACIHELETTANSEACHKNKNKLKTKRKEKKCLPIFLPHLRRKRCPLIVPIPRAQPDTPPSRGQRSRRLLSTVPPPVLYSPPILPLPATSTRKRRARMLPPSPPPQLQPPLYRHWHRYRCRSQHRCIYRHSDHPNDQHGYRYIYRHSYRDSHRYRLPLPAACVSTSSACGETWA